MGKSDIINAINTLIQELNIDKNLISDGQHTFGELYEFRAVLTALLFNQLYKDGYDVYKTKKSFEGEIDEGQFIVVAKLPTGLISFHYSIDKWNWFDIPEKEKVEEFDGHSSKDVLERLKHFLFLKTKL